MKLSHELSQICQVLCQHFLADIVLKLWRMWKKKKKKETESIWRLSCQGYLITKYVLLLQALKWYLFWPRTVKHEPMAGSCVQSVYFTSEGNSALRELEKISVPLEGMFWPEPCLPIQFLGNTDLWFNANKGHLGAGWWAQGAASRAS